MILYVRKINNLILVAHNLNMMLPVLLYCYDAYCGWCYGFSPVMKKICFVYQDIFKMEVLSGGMILPERPVSLLASAAYIQKAYKQVEELTGVRFGTDYLWHINNPDQSDWYPDSEKPAIALSIFKEYYPELQIAFATDLQYALHGEGRDLCDDEAYRHLLVQYDIPAQDFYEKLHNTVYKEKASYEFALVKQLKVTGFPCVFLQVSEIKLYMLAKGYTGYDHLQVNITNVINEINSGKKE